VPVSLVTATVFFRDTSAASTPTPHRPGSWCGALDYVGCHASRSMCPRICRKSVGVKWLSASCRMKYRGMAREGPILDGDGQDQPAQEITQVVGDNPQEQAHLVGPEAVTGEAGQWVAVLPSLIHCSAVPRWL
jgi:hypothetical protein